MTDEKPIEAAPGVTIEPSEEKIKLIVPVNARAAIAFTPDGPRIVLDFDGTRYALHPLAWNDMLEGLAEIGMLPVELAAREPGPSPEPGQKQRSHFTN